MIRSNAHAIIIGINRYRNNRIDNLCCAAQDAREFYGLMTDPRTGGIPPENALLLIDEQATYQKIRSALGNTLLPEQQNKEAVFIFFAGYGSLVDAGESGWQPLLVPYDADPDNLLESALNFEEIAGFFKFMSAREVICIFDCSFAGPPGGRSLITPAAPQEINPGDSIAASLAGEGRVVICACGDSETALEFPNSGHGLFSYYLLEGLQGAADNDRDGAISIDELYKYVYSNVSHKARRYDGNMHPVRRGSLRGRSLVARYDVAGAESAQAVKRRIYELYSRAAKAHKEGDIRVVEDLMQQVLAIHPGEEKARQILKLVEKKRSHTGSKPTPQRPPEKTPKAPERRRSASLPETESADTGHIADPPPPQASPADLSRQPAEEYPESLPEQAAEAAAEVEIEHPAQAVDHHAPAKAEEADEISPEELIGEVEEDHPEAEAETAPEESAPGWKRWFRRFSYIALFSAAAILIYVPFLNRNEELQIFEMLPKTFRPLRAEPVKVPMEAMKVILKKYDFYERDWNPGGKGFTNKLEPVFGADLVIDFAAMLMWQKSGSDQPLRYEEALAYVEELNRSQYYGYRDWRLPTLEEALSLLEPRRNARGGLNISHLFDPTQRWIWTADDESSRRKWTVSFYDGFCYPNDVRYKEFYVRAVR